MSVGRKERWTPEDYMEVVRLIGDGVPLSEALGKTRPAKTSFFARLDSDPELRKAYERAQTMRAQGRISKIEELVAKLEIGKIDPSSAKVAIDALKWLSQKEDPKRYSDIQRSEVSGPEGKNLFPEPKVSDFELARHVAWILGKAERAAVDRGDLLPLPEPAP